MKTKIYHSFQQKLNYFDDDIELIDILRIGVLSGDLTDNESNNLLRHVDPIKHTHIRRRANSDGSRRNTINHLRSSIYSSYIKDVYEEVTQYLRKLLNQASLNDFDSGRLIGEHHLKMDAKTVLKLGSWPNVCKMVTDSVFQSLENERSTLKLLKKVANKLGLEIDEQLINDAIPYLEIRHFLVHSDAKPTAEFIQKYPQIRRRSNGCIQLDYRLICSVRDSIKTLIKAYDEEAINRNLLRDEEVMP